MTCLAALSACEGCRPTTPPASGDGAAGSGAGSPHARLYLLSDVAGALEPCGCVKDQLGGMDHFGALVTKEASKAPAYATLAAGPLFFMDMDVSEEKKSQEVAKAQTIAATMKTLRLKAFAPSRNGFVAGADTLTKLRDESGAALVAANLNAPSLSPVKSTTVTVGELKIGVIGVAAPDKADRVKGALENVSSSPAVPAVKEAAASLRQ
ncbi:MAG TPA: hypothetical protein VM580_11090, partial [Labilithrix sp.]|nr:hypothetical protein [Labilithrix sp.]